MPALYAASQFFVVKTVELKRGKCKLFLIKKNIMNEGKIIIYCVSETIFHNHELSRIILGNVNFFVNIQATKARIAQVVEIVLGLLLPVPAINV